MPQGSRLDALGDFEWPSDVELDLKTVADSGLERGPRAAGRSDRSRAGRGRHDRRVRVFNDPGSVREKFELRWVDEKGTAAGKPTDVYVPPGESRVVRVSRPPASMPHPLLRLRETPKTSTTRSISPTNAAARLTVFYIGVDRADDPEGLLYYPRPRLCRHSPAKRAHLPRIRLQRSWNGSSKKAPQLVIVAAETPKNVSGLRAVREPRGTVLYVVTGPGPAETLASAGRRIALGNRGSGRRARDVMLGEIAFDHPLFVPLAGAQFNDFTKIRFWKYRRIDRESARRSRACWRDSRTATRPIIEKPIGKGTARRPGERMAAR